MGAGNSTTLLQLPTTPFPTADIKLLWKRSEFGGNVYSWQEKNIEGWLCPALFKYFDKPPQELFVKVQ